MNKKFYIVNQTCAIMGFLFCLISLYMRDFKTYWFYLCFILLYSLEYFHGGK